MKRIMTKLAVLALALSLLIVSGASAAILNTAWVTVPSSQWEEVFKLVITTVELNANPVFTVTEYPDYDPAYCFGHALTINDFMKLTYYDDGNDVFNTAVLEIDLSYPNLPSDQAWSAIYATIIASDNASTQDQWVQLMDAICPQFEDVLSGAQRINGAQAATLNGIGYMLDLNADANLARFLANATITVND